MAVEPILNPPHDAPPAIEDAREAALLAAYDGQGRDGAPSQLRSLADETAETIRDRVARGDIRAGERLPPERVLVEELGVSRTVLREALSRLEALGILEARTTRGRYVATGGSAEKSRLLVSAWLHQHATQIDEIDDVRALVEERAMSEMTETQAVTVARKAAAIVERQSRAIGAGVAIEAASCDIAFHRLLCSHTRNRALRSLADALIERMRNPALAVYSLQPAALASLAEHRTIVQALAEGDVRRAARLDARHMSRSGRRHRDGAGSPTGGARTPRGRRKRSSPTETIAPEG